jgi:hypothetical protein
MASPMGFYFQFAQFITDPKKATQFDLDGFGGVA